MEKGHEIVVITRGSIKKTQKEVFDGIKIIQAPFISLYPFYLHIHGIFVNKILRSLEPELDVVHVHSPLCPPIKTSLPVITTIHSPMLTDNRYIKTRSLYALLTKSSARFVSYPLE